MSTQHEGRVACRQKEGRQYRSLGCLVRDCPRPESASDAGSHEAGRPKVTVPVEGILPAIFVSSVVVSQLARQTPIVSPVPLHRAVDLRVPIDREIVSPCGDGISIWSVGERCGITLCEELMGPGPCLWCAALVLMNVDILRETCVARRDAFLPKALQGYSSGVASGCG